MNNDGHCVFLAAADVEAETFAAARVLRDLDRFLQKCLKMKT